MPPVIEEGAGRAAAPEDVQLELQSEKDTSLASSTPSGKDQPKIQSANPAIEGDQKVESKDSRCISILAINGFVIGATFQSVIYKVLALEEKIGLMDWTLLRNILLLLAAVIGLSVKKINPFRSVPRQKWAVMFGRALTSLLLNVFMNASLELIPYSLLVVLYQTSPFMTSILSYCVNSEKITVVEALGMVLSFTAVGFIAYSAEQEVEVDENGEITEERAATQHLLGIGLILLSAACVAGTAVFNRSLKTIDFFVVTVYQGLLGMIVALLYEIGRICSVGEDGSILRLTSLMDGTDGWILALGLFMDVASIFCLTIAYQKSESGFVSLVGFVRIVYALLVDVFIFEESIGFTEIAGSGVICLVTVVVAIDKIKRQSASKQAQKTVHNDNNKDVKLEKPDAEESTDDASDRKK